MAGTFLGINTAVTSLLAQQQALDTLSHNIANAATPGYKRQRVVLAEGHPVTQTFLSGYTARTALGTGVHVEQIQRVQDDFVDSRVQFASGQAAYWGTRSDILGRIETIFSEPGDQGIAGRLDEFWNAWDKLSAQPDDISVRQGLILKAQNLTQQIRATYAQVQDIRDDVGADLSAKVARMNSIITQIADLNTKISWAESGAVTPNDLLDTRDALVTELTGLAGVTVSGKGGREFTVTLGNKVLVQADMCFQLGVRTASDGTQSVYSLSDGESRRIPGGEVAALVSMYNQVIPPFMQNLDGLVSSICNQVNTLHRTGHTLDGTDGGDFFDPTSTAVDFEVDPAILASPRNIAASATGAVGDNAIALAIAALKYNSNAGPQTIGQVYQTIVTGLGTQVALAQQNESTQNASLEQFIAQQQSISGVSLDEEMTDMVKFQQAYNAAARVFTACDEMLSVLIERTGIVGGR